MDSSIFILIWSIIIFQVFTIFFNFLFMIITSFCRDFLEKYRENFCKNSHKKSKNPLKIDKRIIDWLLSWNKNITLKTAEKLTKNFNNYLWISENIEKFFIVENLISKEKERKIIIEFNKNKEENDFWLEIIHYILNGKFQGFGNLWILVLIIVFSVLIFVIMYFIF